MKKQVAYQITALFAGMILMLAGCSNSNRLSVNTSYKQIAYDQLKTYRWYDRKPSEASRKVNEIVRDYIKVAIDRELQAKSLSEKTQGDVDLYLNFSVTAEMQVNVKEHNVYSGVADGYTWRRYGGFQSEVKTEQKTDYVYHKEGTLIIDMIDPVTDKLIWRGIARKRISRDLNQQQRQRVIDEAVAAVLAEFPPKQK